MLGAVPAIAGDQVDASGDCGFGLRCGIAISVRDCAVSLHAVLAKDVIEHIQNRLIPARSRIDHDMHACISEP
jgi:hypothetical protein